MDFFVLNIHRCFIAGSVADGIKNGASRDIFGVGVSR